MTGPVETITIERRRRGFFGWIFLIAFWLFNAFMAYAFFGGMNRAGEQMDAATSSAARAGTAIGTMIGGSMVLFWWLAGFVILGGFVLLTRGRKVTITRTR